MLGLPDGIRGCLFDLDGVLTQTAKVHDAAWKEMFDDYLRERSRKTRRAVRPVRPVADYDEYVDGKPRADGTRSFLESRGIHLPEGSDDDPPDAETVHGLGNRKNEIVLRKIHEDGVEAYPGSVALSAGGQATPGCAARSCRRAPTAGTCWSPPGIEDLFDARIDGVVAEQQHLRGQAGAGHVPGRGAGPRA